MQRKVFRIEEMMSSRRRVGAPAASAMPGTDERDQAFHAIEQELAAMRAAIARSKAEFAGLAKSDSGEKPLQRAQHELTAAIAGMEGATGNILKAAEGADEAARNLVATLHDDYKRGLAQDVMDRVINIYESCNFQDLAGQRISKAIATLRMVEDRLARVTEIWGGLEHGAHHDKPSRSALLNGPKLDGDGGHATQAEIDRMFK